MIYQEKNIFHDIKGMIRKIFNIGKAQCENPEDADLLNGQNLYVAL